MGVFYTNHCIVRNHSCPPHERAQTGCLGRADRSVPAACCSPAAQGSSPGSELAAQHPWGHSGHQAELCQSCPAFLKVRGWRASLGISNTGIYFHTLSSVWHFYTWEFVLLRVLQHSINVSLQSKPPAEHLHRPLAGPAFGVLCMTLLSGCSLPCHALTVHAEQLGSSRRKKHTTSHY